MDTPLFTLENLQRLNAAIATGARIVEYSDKRIQYNTLAELLQLRQLMMNELGLNTGRGSRIFMSFDKGLSGNECNR